LRNKHEVGERSMSSEFDGSAPPVPEPPVPRGHAAQREIHDAARRYRALGGETRLRILRLIAEQPWTVVAIAKTVGVSPSVASRHLSCLAQSGLVERQKRGNRVVCRSTAVGRNALQDVESTLRAPAVDESPLTDHERTTRDERARTERTEELDLYIVLGLPALKYAGSRAEWELRMVSLLGPGLRPELPLLHEACRRILNGKPLDGMALPAELIQRFAPGSPDLPRRP
jgi:DNA-binding transcriptional ArsR family regulator